MRMDKERSKIIERIRKVKVLAEQGVAGERDAAQVLLNELMKKHNISDEDLLDEKVHCYGVCTGGGIYTKLFVQIYLKTFASEERGVWDVEQFPKRIVKDLEILRMGDQKPDVVIQCTKSEFIEVKTLFLIYKPDFDKHIESFLYAYYKKNSLLGDAKGDGKELSLEEKQMLFRAIIMSQGIDKKEVHKLIENE